MQNNPLDDHIDDKIIQQMNNEEKQKSDELATDLRRCLNEWSARFTVQTTEQLFHFRISYQSPRFHLHMHMAMPFYFSGYNNSPVAAAKYIVDEFEAKIWEQCKDIFEGRARSNRQLFRDMLWRASEQHYNTGGGNAFKTHEL